MHRSFCEALFLHQTKRRSQLFLIIMEQKINLESEAGASDRLNMNTTMSEQTLNIHRRGRAQAQHHAYRHA